MGANNNPLSSAYAWEV